MHKRFLATIVLALALVLGQGGTFLVAALCPHLSSNAVSCESQVAPAEAAAHHEMDHMQPDSTAPQSTLNVNATAAAVTEPMGSCKHCAIHSGTSPNTGSFHELNISQRSADPTLLAPVAAVASVSTLPAAVLASRSHGPPGNEISRHILINIFRI